MRVHEKAIALLTEVYETLRHIWPDERIFALYGGVRLIDIML